MGRTGSGKASFHAKKRKTNRGDSDSDSSSDEDRLKPKLKTSHVAAVEKTTSFTVKCMPDYRRRKMKFVDFIVKEYPALAEELIYELTPEQMADPRRHYHKATHDFYFQKLPASVLQSFLSSQWKDKEKGIKYTFDHLRKYHDAILKCAEFPPYNLPRSYGIEMRPYLDNLEKELADAKSDGKVTEQDADPICFGLYKQLCIWAVMTGRVFVWVFLVLQWNLMARPMNVDGISFQNFWANGDSVVFKYNTNKKDRKGANTTEKHCYANPENPFICLFLALGCYLCIFQQKFDSGKKIDAPVKPLRLLKHGSLPRKIRRAYDNNWKPIMELMENEVADEIRNRHVDGMNYDFFKSTYDEAFKGVCEKYPEFADTAKTKNWKVSTYCKKVATVKSQRKKAMV